MPVRRSPSAASQSKARRASQDPISAFASSFEQTCLAYAAQLGAPELSQGSLDYFSVLVEAVDLHIRKVAGYGKPDDAWANFRRVADMGLDPVTGIIVRMNDKMSRLNNLERTGGEADMIGEGRTRELADMLGYSGIALAMEKERARG